MVDDDFAPFGDRTIEGAFLNDVEYGFESDIGTISVSTRGQDPHEIQDCTIDLERKQIGSKEWDGDEHPVVELRYKLTIPVEMAVRDGDDVVVDGFEATWTFNDVSVESVGPNQTSVITHQISKSFGDTSEPDEL